MRILPFGSPRANGAEQAAGQQALASVQSYDEQRLDEETGAEGWLTVAQRARRAIAAAWWSRA